jgi:hypothetical protein
MAGPVTLSLGYLQKRSVNCHWLPPYFLYYGRRARLPLSTILPDTAAPPDLLGNRLSDMAEVFKQAKQNTEHSRLHNRARLAKKATAGEIVVGDSVIVAANEPVSLSAKWDPQYEVTKVHGTTALMTHPKREQSTSRKATPGRSKHVLGRSGPQAPMSTSPSPQRTPPQARSCA